MVTEARSLHLEKAPSPIVVSPLGMVTVVRPQPEKALSPSVVKLLGMVFLFKFSKNSEEQILANYHVTTRIFKPNCSSSL
ncbi:MAG: hypothetical protein FWG84_04905 [Bacteroidales bacterium]|nr:hypothetical protein [Bacteroidales bacterium]